MNRWSVVGAVFAGLAVITGAFAAHGLGDRFEKLYGSMPDKVVAGAPIPAAHKYLGDFKTAADYQFWHALALLFLGLTGRRCRLLTAAGVCFVLGIVLFSGSLYLLTLLAMPKLGMITPLGGLAFIIGWVLLALGLRGRAKPADSVRNS
ncbi:DUF423 domain-containing protein [Rubinisphaera margarita]|uniref:DUF423 domain-containing protein n=1 Tax=Rubinisphaera margarita TaxID=2909586 RepID=UPI001EE8F2FE|nr:DUF423 domain-containing protein [Rubinisphaera margarita]MCG6154463.1 DUF423 domain-containing protein [Rubinisphaera margarita]